MTGNLLQMITKCAIRQRILYNQLSACTNHKNHTKQINEQTEAPTSSTLSQKSLKW